MGSGEGGAAHEREVGWKSVLALTAVGFAAVIALGALVAWLTARGTRRQRAQLERVETQADLIVLREALEAWADAHGGRYPEHLDALLAGGGLAALPVDRWGRGYVFEPPPGGTRDAGRGRIASLGADGAPGGSGEDADLDEAALGLSPR